jgi:hypothetical protein
LLVEVRAALASEMQLDPKVAGKKLEEFYGKVDKMFKEAGDNEDIVSEAGAIFAYLKAATKATNDKYSRVIRGEYVGEILLSASKIARTSATRKAAKKK